jgi:hypothetical protein
MSQIKIRIDVDLYPNSRNADRLMQRLINKNFKELLEDGEPYEYPINDPEFVGESMFANLVGYIHTDENSPFWGKKTEEEIAQYIRNCGINGGKIYDWVSNVLLKSNPSNAIQKMFADPTVNKDGKVTNKTLSTYKKQLKEFVANGGSITTLSCIEAENLIGSEDLDIYAVRSKNGDHDCLFYSITKDADRHIIRKEYTCDTLCSYYDAREILRENWLDLDEEHKYQTSL